MAIGLKGPARPEGQPSPGPYKEVAGTGLRTSDLVLAAFSGGADSTALGLLLRDLGYSIVLGHVDHQMRPTSGAEAEHCVRVAAILGVPILVERVEVDPPSEAAARRVRYLALEKMAAACGAAKIATGHTLDDHIETILMRMGRGGRAFGIPATRGLVVRPLIDLRRADTEAVCTSAGVAFVSDPSNQDESFERNRIRRRVVPGLSDEETTGLLRTAEANRKAAARLDRRLSGAERAGRIFVDQDSIRIDRRWLSTQPEGLRRAAIRRAAKGAGIELGSRLVADIDRKVAAFTGARLDLPERWAIVCESEHLVLEVPRPPAGLPEVELAAPGTTRLPEWGLEVVVAILEPEGSVPLVPDGRSLGAETKVDATALGNALTLRSRRPGDRLRPLGMQGSKKLQDLFVDAKVPRRKRDRVPVVVSGDCIVWVAGHRIDDRFRPRPAPAKTASIQIFTLLHDQRAAI